MRCQAMCYAKRTYDRNDVSKNIAAEFCAGESATLCGGRGVSEGGTWNAGNTNMVRRGDFALVDGYNGAVASRQSTSLARSSGKCTTHESRPTPNPLMMGPTTMITKPGVNVCTAPPIVKMTAPMNSVPFLPRVSPTRPAASDVTDALSASRCARHRVTH